MNFIRGNPQWYIQTISFWGHSLSSILGVAMAYLFYKYKDFSFIEKYVSNVIFLCIVQKHNI